MGKYRFLLGLLAVLFGSLFLDANKATVQAKENDKKTLIIYFSMSNTTKEAAELIPESITRENVDLAEIVADVCDEFAVEARNKGFEIIDGIDYDSPMEGNAFLLASVFRNLIGNALAYSGGSRIELRQSVDDAGLTVTVADNGTGVPEEHLPRLFERFYRVDKGRSRQLGGTGLGLSIVKNAVLWHGGTVSVRNRKEGGLEIVIRFIKT